MTLTPYESDIAGEPAALRRFAASAMPSGLDSLDLERFERIVLSGMGSSHHAANPTWRRFVAAGRPAWWVSTPLLLDRPELVGRRTLLVLTSQSGRSGEIVALLEQLPADRERRLVAVTNDAGSPLALAADVVIELMSGDEATVSTKSYANSLAAHARLADALTGADDAARVASILRAADALDALGTDLGELSDLAAALVAQPQPRLALVADPARGASALFGGLILKEATKLPAEGFVGGEFRHGPLELAGPSLAAVLFGTIGEDTSLGRLAGDLVAAGSQVLKVGGGSTSAAGRWIPTAASDELGELVCDAAVVQHLSVTLARANGTVPGAFRFGAKVTTIL